MLAGGLDDRARRPQAGGVSLSDRFRLVVMVSGNGSNLQAILDAVADGRLDAEVVAVVSNRRAAYGLERAEAALVSTAYAPFKPYRDQGRPRTDYDAELAELVECFSPDLVVLAGWMHVLSSTFLDRFPQQVVNLHPALPGQFAGTHAIERAWQAAQAGEITRTGVMVHMVVPEVDAGPVLATQVVHIEPGLSLQALEARMHEVEHVLLVEAIAGVVGAREEQRGADDEPVDFDEN